MKNKTVITFFMILFVSTHCLAEDVKVDFKEMQQILKKDRLSNIVKEKNRKRRLKEKKRNAIAHASYNIPSDRIFWGMYSEIWLVQNASLLKWNFEKPDYGLAMYFKEFLEKQGVFELGFKILLVNSPDVYHFALPSNQGEVIFLLGLPFIRNLDLTKLEISLILYEDYMRHKYGFFKKYVEVKGMDKFLGSNFKGKKFNNGLLAKVSSRYNDMIFNKGFSFSQQYQVTRDMGNLLKSDMKIWNAYFLLIKKKKDLVTKNLLFKKYLRIYPNPELQLNWLSPLKQKIL